MIVRIAHLRHDFCVCKQRKEGALRDMSVSFGTPDRLGGPMNVLSLSGALVRFRFSTCLSLNCSIAELLLCTVGLSKMPCSQFATWH